MIVRTAWAQDGEPAGVMDWRYPVLAEEPFPFEPVNRALGAIYNHPNDELDTPYLFTVRDAAWRIIGLVITDPEEVELDLEDIGAMYAQVMDEAQTRRHVRHRLPDPDPPCNIEGDTFAIDWVHGFVFPVDPLNAILAACYDAGVRPFLYPAFDRDDDESELRQVGLLITGTLDLAGDPSENWRMIRDRYRSIFDDDEVHPGEVPWEQREWSLS